MSNLTPFEQIKKFCKDKNLSKLQERIMFHKYTEDYNELISNHIEAEGIEPPDDTLKGFRNTLLSESTLSTNSKLSEDEIKENLKTEIRKAEKKYSRTSFWSSVGAGILASTLFTIMLIVVISLAQSQVKSWVNDLYSTQTHIEQKVDGK